MPSYRPTRYDRPATVEEALAQLASPGARALGGGTLLGLLRPATRALVDLAAIGVGAIRAVEGRIEIGAQTTLAQAERDPHLAAPGLRAIAEAARAVSPMAVREFATVGGNLVGAAPFADLPPALVALEARLRIQVEGAVASLRPADGFVVAPYRSALPSGGLLTHVLVEPWADWSGFHCVSRTSYDPAIAALAVALAFATDGSMTRVRLVAGALGPAPQRLPTAEAALCGAPLGASATARAATAAAAEAVVIGDHRGGERYRRALLAVCVRDLLARVPVAGGRT